MLPTRQSAASSAARHIVKLVDDVLLRVAVWVIPSALACLTLFAFFELPNPYSARASADLSFSAVEDRTENLSPKIALHITDVEAPILSLETKRSPHPFWLRVHVADRLDGASLVELASRHAKVIACWDVRDLSTTIGSATLDASEGRVTHRKSGFTIQAPPPSTILCRAVFEGPAKISFKNWSEDQFARSEQDFHRSSGLLEGGVLVLAIFIFVVAIINRERTYFLFSCWLVANLRLAALSEGWDTMWLERQIPPDFHSGMRMLSIAAYGILTIALFGKLFEQELKAIRSRGILPFIQGAWIALLLASPALSFSRFLPIMWACVALGASGLVMMLLEIMIKERSRVAMWYTSSMALTLITGLSEVLAAALGLRGQLSAINSVTGALASSLLSAFAIAEHLRRERAARLSAQAEALKNLERLEQTYNELPVALFTATASGDIPHFNPMFAQVLQTPPPGTSALTWGMFFGARDWERLCAPLAGSPHSELEVEGTRLDGSVRWFSVRASRRDELIECSIQDITEKRQALGQLRFLANHDPLTNLMNRRGVEPELRQMILRCGQGSQGALAYLDLNRFKLVNDLYGHVTGDAVLSEVSSRFQKHLLPAHRLARTGGDEFLIVFHDTDFSSARQICMEIVQDLEEYPCQCGDKAFSIGVAIGLLEVDAHIIESDAIKAADRACQEAKIGLQGHVVAVKRDSEYLSESIKDFRMMERMGADIPFERFFLEMQPILSLAAPFAQHNFEVLLRMRDIEGAVLSPGKFLSAAERSGKMAAIDRWVVSNTLNWIEEHLDKIPNTQFVCVNLSGASLNDERFVETIFAMLRNSERAVSRMCFEITEDIALRDLRNARRFIDRLHALDAKVALDDFGAGYTSFTYLKELPAEALKIDGAFIRDIDEHPSNCAIVQAIVELARQLGMRTIAEWAETPQTVSTLSSIGVDYVQGWAICASKPPSVILSARSSGELVQNPEVRSILINQSDGGTADLWDHVGTSPTILH